MSCGSSSIPVRLRIWPTRVTRGLMLPAGQVTRNRIARLLQPDRASLTKIGPADSRLIAIAANKRIGANKTSPMVAMTMSMTRLVHSSSPMTAAASAWTVARATRSLIYHLAMP